jgi:hypothetical protein
MPDWRTSLASRLGVAPALQTSRADLVPALKQAAFVPDARARRFNRS